MDMFSAALSLVIHKKGSVTESDVDDLLDRYRTKQLIIIDKHLFLQALSKALQHFAERTRCLFVCTEISCRKKAYLNFDDASLQALSVTLGCQVEATGYHWICDDAPVLTLKIEQKLASFADCSSEEALQEASASIKSLLSKGALHEVNHTNE